MRPADLVDPDVHLDPLPQPYRLVADLTNEIYDQAWDTIVTKHPKLATYSADEGLAEVKALLLHTCHPSVTLSESVVPISATTDIASSNDVSSAVSSNDLQAIKWDKDGASLFLGTRDGRVLLCTPGVGGTHQPSNESSDESVPACTWLCEINAFPGMSCGQLIFSEPSGSLSNNTLTIAVCMSPTDMHTSTSERSQTDVTIDPKATSKVISKVVLIRVVTQHNEGTADSVYMHVLGSTNIPGVVCVLSLAPGGLTLGIGLTDGWVGVWALPHFESGQALKTSNEGSLPDKPIGLLLFSHAPIAVESPAETSVVSGFAYIRSAQATPGSVILHRSSSNIVRTFRLIEYPKALELQAKLAALATPIVAAAPKKGDKKEPVKNAPIQVAPADMGPTLPVPAFEPGQLLMTSEWILPSNVTALACSGSNVVVIGTHSGAMFVWDLRTGCCRVPLERHQAPVRSIVISPANIGTQAHVISGSDDGCIHFYDISMYTQSQTHIDHDTPPTLVKSHHDVLLGMSVIHIWYTTFASLECVIVLDSSGRTTAYDVASGKLLGTVLAGGPEDVSAQRTAEKPLGEQIEPATSSGVTFAGERLAALCRCSEELEGMKRSYVYRFTPESREKIELRQETCCVAVYDAHDICSAFMPVRPLSLSPSKDLPTSRGHNTSRNTTARHTKVVRGHNAVGAATTPMLSPHPPSHSILHTPGLLANSSSKSLSSPTRTRHLGTGLVERSLTREGSLSPGSPGRGIQKSLFTAGGGHSDPIELVRESMQYRKSIRGERRQRIMHMRQELMASFG